MTTTFTPSDVLLLTVASIKKQPACTTLERQLLAASGLGDYGTGELSAATLLNHRNRNEFPLLVRTRTDFSFFTFRDDRDIAKAYNVKVNSCVDDWRGFRVYPTTPHTTDDQLREYVYQEEQKRKPNVDTLPTYSQLTLAVESMGKITEDTITEAWKLAIQNRCYVRLKRSSTNRAFMIRPQDTLEQNLQRFRPIAQEFI